MNRILSASASVLAMSASVSAVAWDEWRCIFHQTVAGQLYSWDFRPLYKPAGQEYTFRTTYPDGSTNNAYIFNVCGTVSQKCTPDWTEQYSSGIAQQYLGDPNFNQATCNMGCTDPETGRSACCNQCFVLAHQYPDYELVDSGNPANGVEALHYGSEPDSSAPFQCNYNKAEGCNSPRQINYVITCDTTNKDATRLSNIFVNETGGPGSCAYTMQASSYAACPTKGDPFDPYRDDPAHSFGFVVLGAALTIFLSYTYTFGDSRSWWDPIKQRIPAITIPGVGTFGGGKGYGGSSYRAVASTTPIAASAYGAT